MGPATRSFPAIGTTAVVAVTDPGAADEAAAILRAELAELDAACSRFRPDSELAAVERQGGIPVPVSALLYEVVGTACDVALMTGGAVDPTVGSALEALGYDRDFAAVGDHPSGGGRERGAGDVAAIAPAPGWWTITLDPARRTITIPDGVRVDVGSSAKALAADRGAAGIAETLGTGVVVSLGGDVSTAGPPPHHGWAVGIARSSSAPVHAVDQVVAVDAGAVASSSPGVRAWERRGRRHHHIVDPRTGRCASTEWALVSVSAPTCVEANALSTAAIVWGAGALDRLAAAGRPARLVHAGGEVHVVHGWPSDGASPTPPATPRPSAAAAPARRASPRPTAPAGGTR